MIDPVSAFAAISAGHAAIRKAMEIGKDLSSLSGAVSKYAQGEASLQFGEARKKNSRFSFAEDSAIEKHFKKEQLETMRSELRTTFMLYGKPGQWERLQAEIASERARIKKHLEEQARKRDLMIQISVGTVIAIIGGAAIYYWALFLKGTL